MRGLQERLKALSSARLQGMGRGIEKESLRVTQDGALAHTPHPLALGAALTHPHITTDFSEAQLELITGVHPSAEAAELELTQVHQAVYRALGDEMMWVGSMPCSLPPDDQIPLGQYGTSNVGQAKTVYRMGLGHRYGRRMQTISGIHYNWSMPEVSNERVFRPDPQFPPAFFPAAGTCSAHRQRCSSSFVDGGRVSMLQPLR